MFPRASYHRKLDYRPKSMNVGVSLAWSLPFIFLCICLWFGGNALAGVLSMHDKLLEYELPLFSFLRLEIPFPTTVYKKKQQHYYRWELKPCYKGLVSTPVRSKTLIINCSSCCKNQYVLKRFQAINNIFFGHEYIILVVLII